MTQLRRFSSLGAFLALLAFFVSAGGHLLVLQSVAWGKMIAAYSRQDTVSHALVKTFDGKHPCEMCKSIAKARSSEKRHGLLSESRRPDSWDARGFVQGLSFFPGAFERFPIEWRVECLGEAVQPPVPPPQLS